MKTGYPKNYLFKVKNFVSANVNIRKTHPTDPINVPWENLSSREDFNWDLSIFINGKTHLLGRNNSKTSFPIQKKKLA